MNLIAPAANLEEGTLISAPKEEGVNSKSTSRFSPENFFLIMEGLLLLDPSVSVGQIQENCTRGKGGVNEYPLDGEKFILQHTQEGKMGSEQSVASMREIILDLLEDMRNKTGKNNIINVTTEEGSGNSSQHQQLGQRVSGQLQELSATNLPESLSERSEINLTAPDLNEKILSAQLPETLAAREGQIEQKSLFQPLENRIVGLSGNSLPDKEISQALLEESQEGLSNNLKKALADKMGVERTNQGQSSGQHEKPAILVQETPALNQKIGSYPSPFSEEGMSTSSQKILANQTNIEGIKPEVFSGNYERSGNFLQESPSPDQEIKPGLSDNSAEKSAIDLSKNPNNQTEKLFLSGKPANAELYYLEDSLTNGKLKIQKASPDEDPLALHTAKSLRGTNELSGNNPVNKNHSSPVTHSSYSNILEEKVVEQVVKYARLNFKPGISEVELHLKPESLGSLKIKISMEGQEVKASFFADTPLVKEIIENHLPALRQAFLSQNLDLQKFSVFVGNHQGRENTGNNDLRDFPKDKDDRRNGEEKKIGDLEEVRKPEYDSLNAIDCFV
jgi:flagellar hook-length control protein FliK